MQSDQYYYAGSAVSRAGFGGGSRSVSLGHSSSNNTGRFAPGGRGGTPLAQSALSYIHSNDVIPAGIASSKARVRHHVGGGLQKSTASGQRSNKSRSTSNRD